MKGNLMFRNQNALHHGCNEKKGLIAELQHLTQKWPAHVRVQWRSSPY